MVLAGVYDSEDSQKIKSALTRNSWRIKAKKLLEGSRKPHIQEIQCILKEVNCVNCFYPNRYKLRLMIMLKLVSICVIIIISFYQFLTMQGRSGHKFSITSTCLTGKFLLQYCHIPNPGPMGPGL